MKLNIGKKKLNIRNVNGFWNRFKILKFDLQPLKEGILLKNRKFLNTYLYCQKVDVIMTDKENKILYLYINLKTEKIIFYKKKVYNTYILPPNICEDLKIGDTLKIK